ncbi:MAG: LysM peptidoglycan-binding domain-containing protein [Anaerolineae bacterium]|nr:LysM peptidoglycan-binding domain-containing protein [Anaerolineae bacterium]
MISHSQTFRYGILLVVALGLLSLFAVPQPASAQSGDVDTLLQMINNLRAQYGLAAYRFDPVLASAAQAHTEWAASVGTHSHTGRGGSSPTDRALAAGYGGGNSVRVSENIYYGTNGTASSAFQWWSNSPIHFQGMTSTNYTDIGIGVVYNQNGGFFTLMFGRTGAAPPSSAPPASSSGSAALPTRPSYTIVPVEVAEPREDGAVIHVVQEGQAVWNIAEAYDTAVSEILALNRLDEDSIINPGDELIIVPAPIRATPQPTGPIYHTVQSGQTLGGIALAYGLDLNTLLALNNLNDTSLIYPDQRLLIRPGDPTATPPPTETVHPAVTPTPVSVQAATPTLPPSEFGPPEAGISSPRDTLTLVVVLLAVAGVVLLGVGVVMLRPRP